MGSSGHPDVARRARAAAVYAAAAHQILEQYAGRLARADGTIDLDRYYTVDETHRVPTEWAAPPVR